MCTWRLGAWSLLLAFCSSAWCAEITSPADRDSITQQQKTLLEQAQQQREALQNSVELPALPLPEPAAAGRFANRCGRSFSGRRTSFLVGKESLARPYQGRCLTLEHINRLVHETTNAYLQRGYVTSQAWLQEQDISRGVLTVSVSEGRIESITQNGEQTPALKMAFPGLVGDVLNLRDIEQGMEQLNRLPSQQVTIDIQPGEQPGFSKVVLLRGATRVPVSFSFGADNSGQKSTGTGQMNAAFSLDNPLRLADQWSLSAARNNDFSPHHRSRSLNGSVTLPYGYWLFSYQYAWNDFSSRCRSAVPLTAIRAITRPSVWAPTARCCGMANASWPSISGWRGAPRKISWRGTVGRQQPDAQHRQPGPQLQCGRGRRLYDAEPDGKPRVAHAGRYRRRSGAQRGAAQRVSQAWSQRQLFLSARTLSTT